jgi:hypothetical protein
MKKSLILFLGLGILLCLMATTGFAQQYHLMYSGNHFRGYDFDDDWNGFSGGIYGMTAGTELTTGVNFPDSADGMQVQRVSISVIDNSTGNFRVALQKVDRWSGTVTWVAELTTAGLSSSSSVQYVNIPKSLMTAPGIDSDRYAWYIMVFFDSQGSVDLYLKTVTIRYY